MTKFKILNYLKENANRYFSPTFLKHELGISSSTTYDYCRMLFNEGILVRKRSTMSNLNNRDVRPHFKFCYVNELRKCDKCGSATIYKPGTNIAVCDCCGFEKKIERDY